MADENKEALMQPAFNPGYSAAYGPPPPMMAPPRTAPPQSYGAPGSYVPPPVAPPPAYNPYQQQAYNATYGQPGVPVQPPVQQPPVQPAVIQVTQQVSERQAASGIRTAPRSRFDVCGCRNAWRRPNGFILAGILIVLGLGSLIFGAIHQRSRYNETKDYEEGTCKNYHINRVNDTSHVQCERPACSGKSSRRCKHSYTCNAVIGRVHYSGGNRSELVQIYATYDESEKYTGMCSYTPNEDCKYSTENYFKSRGAFEGKEYLCFYSTSIPLKVLLEKNEDVGTSAFIVPCVILVLGIALLVAVKFFGHKFNCPSQSQLLKQQQEHQQQQQQLQPLNQPQTT